LINQAVIPQLINLTIGNWPVYVPASGLSGAMYSSIMGRPVIEVEYASALGTTGDIMLASLSNYQTITKGGIKADSSIHVAFTTDETAFRFVYRVDGSPLWSSALTPFKGSATQSPFVVLTSASA
jgi:HK97 family phage major capsid protein